jgi:3-oxoacyl-[acyl-carrier-protein] synthase-3
VEEYNFLSAQIKAISYYLPEGVLTNNQLADIYEDWTPEKIYEKTGISRRHLASEGETALDLAVKACHILFDEHGILPEQIDFILLATQSPDYLLPTTACILQDKLGIPRTAGALDFNLGCSAYIYGLALAKSLIHSNIAKNVLLVTAETYSKHIHPMDKSTRTIFGDGAAATIISSSESDKIGAFALGTDGSGAENLIIAAGGSRKPKNELTKSEIVNDNGSIHTEENLYMNGPEIFNFTIREIPKCFKEVLEKNQLTTDDIDLFVFHQANKFMLDYLRKKLKIPEEKFYVNLSDIGNTVSATIPIALAMALNEQKIKKGDRIMLVGFGVGLSWGATIIQW